MSKPGNLFESDADFSIVNKLNGYIPRDIDQIKHEDIIDIPENRFFKYFIIWKFLSFILYIHYKL